MILFVLFSFVSCYGPNTKVDKDLEVSNSVIHDITYNETGMVFLVTADNVKLLINYCTFYKIGNGNAAIFYNRDGKNGDFTLKYSCAREIKGNGYANLVYCKGPSYSIMNNAIYCEGQVTINFDLNTNQFESCNVSRNDGVSSICNNIGLVCDVKYSTFESNENSYQALFVESSSEKNLRNCIFLHNKGYGIMNKCNLKVYDSFFIGNGKYDIIVDANNYYIYLENCNFDNMRISGTIKSKNNVLEHGTGNPKNMNEFLNTDKCPYSEFAEPFFLPLQTLYQTLSHTPIISETMINTLDWTPINTLEHTPVNTIENTLINTIYYTPFKTIDNTLSQTIVSTLEQTIEPSQNQTPPRTFPEDCILAPDANKNRKYRIRVVYALALSFTEEIVYM